jgi:ribosome-binding protein aMBF1 (putative translation factor)
MTKAELLVLHFARCLREYRSRTPDVQVMMERLATTIADPDVSQAAHADAISSLTNLLFPGSKKGNEFAGRVARLLQQKGLRQSELAKMIGVSEPVISRMLSGWLQPRRRTVERIAAALDVRPDELRPI